MFRNQYDTDVTTWSPQGRLHQVEYAMEAVKQGSAAVGVKSKTHVVLAALNRSDNELSSALKKVFKIDDHLGIAISGLAPDGRVLCRYMRNECLSHKFIYESPLSTSRLARQIADRAQVGTQRSWKRPCGVGLLVGGTDKNGVKLFYNCPSGNFYDYKAMAIGGRSQAARTYLERKFENFPDENVDALINHTLQALSASLQEGELTTENCTIGVVGLDMQFTLIEGEALNPYLAALKDDGPDAGAGDDDGAAPMET